MKYLKKFESNLLEAASFNVSLAEFSKLYNLSTINIVDFYDLLEMNDIKYEVVSIDKKIIDSNGDEIDDMGSYSPPSSDYFIKTCFIMRIFVTYLSSDDDRFYNYYTGRIFSNSLSFSDFNSIIDSIKLTNNRIKNLFDRFSNVKNVDIKTNCNIISNFQDENRTRQKIMTEYNIEFIERNSIKSQVLHNFNNWKQSSINKWEKSNLSPTEIRHYKEIIKNIKNIFDQFEIENVEIDTNDTGEIVHFGILTEDEIIVVANYFKEDGSWDIDRKEINRAINLLS